MDSPSNREDTSRRTAKLDAAPRSSFTCPWTATVTNRPWPQLRMRRLLRLATLQSRAQRIWRGRAPEWRRAIAAARDGEMPMRAVFVAIGRTRSTQIQEGTLSVAPGFVCGFAFVAERGQNFLGRGRGQKSR